MYHLHSPTTRLACGRYTRQSFPPGTLQHHGFGFPLRRITDVAISEQCSQLRLTRPEALASETRMSAISSTTTLSAPPATQPGSHHAQFSKRAVCRSTKTSIHDVQIFSISTPAAAARTPLRRPSRARVDHHTSKKARAQDVVLPLLFVDMLDVVAPYRGILLGFRHQMLVGLVWRVRVGWASNSILRWI
ncbi:hypothetical protein BU16DRAFT_95446 [Lophium mytilinum]|uniref:Uncharacterized protein n=1 Tax=Lophium mytilinum TaxID=390894 RepID=A0A6A6QLI6_9PEZI|nr:hypothetical protein BU16DRAFT_95446 [Lophium mytilinum]